MEIQTLQETTSFIGTEWQQALSRVCPPMSMHNRNWFKLIIHSQLNGQAELPYGLGLDNASYMDLKRTIASDDISKQELLWKQPYKAGLRKRAQVLEEVFELRMQERNELSALLFAHCNDKVPFAFQMAIIVATACLSQSHLWHSLGLRNRSELGELLKYNFPLLHQQNTNNMRWKRFFYRQLCQQGGDYVCRAPSCQECSSYSECFVD
ncbi:nitrogen fixation protein NifQ [Agarivorans albus]|uniref:Nitrogenase FeMo-cofactor synthesis molybdenum delivery protein NifQ n=1 Tax=Agarivorans albus MKT 106 TaxID=1331007 RepID=R9PK78_AGAAL|nr:nitrogen fixation protein NifQ [Agarivorans albus]GAD01752.1 nitrogenase FeMo-cofactor synthesis molybdenum delivery protein NifQ [Agarivorans albus MKT 106]